jgi:hypothetical protein
VAVTAAEVALTRARLRAASGADLGALRDLPPVAARAVAVAREVGAPLLPVLDAAEEVLRQERELADAVAAAAAPARTVAIAMLALPAVAVPVLGRLLDLDLVAFYTTSAGLVVGALAAGLWVAGAGIILALVRGTSPRPATPTARIVLVALVAWALAGPVAAAVGAAVARLTWRAPPPPPPDDLDAACDLLAAVLLAGLPAGPGLRVVADHLPGLAVPLRRLALAIELGRPPDADALGALTIAITDGLATGAPLTPALRALARRLRADRAAAAREAAGRLPARLTFPTALCLLPATVLAIGAPIVGAGLGAVSGT